MSGIDGSRFTVSRFFRVFGFLVFLGVSRQRFLACRENLGAQTIQHPSHGHVARAKVYPVLFREHSVGVRQLERTLELFRRLDGNAEKTSELLLARGSAAFDDVEDY